MAENSRAKTHRNCQAHESHGCHAVCADFTFLAQSTHKDPIAVAHKRVKSFSNGLQGGNGKRYSNCSIKYTEDLAPVGPWYRVPITYKTQNSLVRPYTIKGLHGLETRAKALVTFMIRPDTLYFGIL